MPTLNHAIDALSRHVGFQAARLRSLARRLQDADVLPSGAPGVAPEVQLRHVVDLLLAVASDATLRRAATAVEAYRATTPGGADLSQAPASVRATAGQQLEALARLAMDGDADARRMRVEIVSTWPEVVFLFEDGTAHRFQSVGTLSGHWQMLGHRRATTINGAALADAIIELFGGRK
ncbi:hypothetical protein [Ciceribacter selenitireducens]|uniref:hypothetical protein n=1 Tax=Ciceribacter selenitireducens TaxID=448181 RepID=UPI0011C07039|nr:hypothetical protein [Ciceribacter selenitireducens]